MHDLRPILFVSSDIAKRDNIASRLRYSQFKTELATSGFHTIHLLENAKLEKEPFSLLLLLGPSEDMPADEIISLSRNIFTAKEMPILYLTLDNDPEHKLEIVDLGGKVMTFTDNFGALLQAVNKITGIKTK